MPTILNDFADFLVNQVIVYPFSDRNSHGVPVYGSPLTTRGRYVQKPRLVRRGDGAEVTSSSYVTIAPVPGLTPEARVLVDGVEKVIAALGSAPDETADTYYQRIFFT